MPSCITVTLIKYYMHNVVDLLSYQESIHLPVAKFFAQELSLYMTTALHYICLVGALTVGGLVSSGLTVNVPNVKCVMLAMSCAIRLVYIFLLESSSLRSYSPLLLICTLYSQAYPYKWTTQAAGYCYYCRTFKTKQ